MTANLQYQKYKTKFKVIENRNRVTFTIFISVAWDTNGVTPKFKTTKYLLDTPNKDIKTVSPDSFTVS